MSRDTILQVQGAREETVHHRGRLEESRNVALMVLHVLECSSILIYVLYKSRSLTFVTMIYS